jgi:hypothetical protein
MVHPPTQNNVPKDDMIKQIPDTRDNIMNNMIICFRFFSVNPPGCSALTGPMRESLSTPFILSPYSLDTLDNICKQRVVVMAVTKIHILKLPEAEARKIPVRIPETESGKVLNRKLLI